MRSSFKNTCIFYFSVYFFFIFRTVVSTVNKFYGVKVVFVVAGCTSVASAAADSVDEDDDDDDSELVLTGFLSTSLRRRHCRVHE